VGSVVYQVAVLPSYNSLQGYSQLTLLTVCFVFFFLNFYWVLLILLIIQSKKSVLKELGDRFNFLQIYSDLFWFFLIFLKFLVNLFELLSEKKEGGILAKT